MPNLRCGIVLDREQHVLAAIHGKFPGRLFCNGSADRERDVLLGWVLTLRGQRADRDCQKTEPQQERCDENGKSSRFCGLEKPVHEADFNANSTEILVGSDDDVRRRADGGLPGQSGKAIPKMFARFTYSIPTSPELPDLRPAHTTRKSASSSPAFGLTVISMPCVRG